MPTAPLNVPADVEVSEELVSRLIAAQHPDLSGPVHRFSEGWDNVIYRVGDQILARMPRRRIGVPNVLNEQRLLSRLPPLELEVPVPLRCGVPGLGYPYPWSLVPFFEGEMVGLSSTDPADLLAFFRRLHVPAPEDAPVRASRSMPLIEKTPFLEERFHVTGAHEAEIREIWTAALGASPHPGPRVWVHGDLHPFNLLLRNGRLSAVLDWGDVFGGDPAPDVAAVWMLHPPERHGLFQEALDDALWKRGMGWAVYYGVALVNACRDGAHAGFGAVGEETLLRLRRAAASA